MHHNMAYIRMTPEQQRARGAPDYGGTHIICVLLFPTTRNRSECLGWYGSMPQEYCHSGYQAAAPSAGYLGRLQIVREYMQQPSALLSIPTQQLPGTFSPIALSTSRATDAWSVYARQLHRMGRDTRRERKMLALINWAVKQLQPALRNAFAAAYTRQPAAGYKLLSAMKKARASKNHVV